MKFHEYEEAARRTANGGISLVNAALGLTGEAGEFADTVKKNTFHGLALTEDRRLELVKELGDLLWYVTMGAEVLGFTLEAVARLNVEKLAKRYPEGFTPEASEARVDECNGSGNCCDCSKCGGSGCWFCDYGERVRTCHK